MDKILTIFFYLISFSVFVLLQSLVINGIYYCFSGSCTNDINKGRICNGNIFYKINPDLFERHRGKWYVLPLFGCVRCMASVWSLVTFFPIVIHLFGFHWIEIYAWVIDAFSLTILNWIIYKKL